MQLHHTFQHRWGWWHAQAHAAPSRFPGKKHPAKPLSAVVASANAVFAVRSVAARVPYKTASTATCATASACNQRACRISFNCVHSMQTTSATTLTNPHSSQKATSGPGKPGATHQLFRPQCTPHRFRRSKRSKLDAREDELDSCGDNFEARSRDDRCCSERPLDDLQARHNCLEVAVVAVGQVLIALCSMNCQRR